VRLNSEVPGVISKDGRKKVYDFKKLEEKWESIGEQLGVEDKSARLQQFNYV